MFEIVGQRTSPPPPAKQWVTIAALVYKDNSDIIVTRALVNCTREKPQISAHESKVTGNRTK